MKSFPTRCAGVFVPTFAIRTNQDFGVGDTRGVVQMIEWCSEMGFAVLQLLPINETSDDNSPYNAISSVALDITTLAIDKKQIPGLSDQLIKSLISEKELEALNQGPVSYRRVKSLKWKLCEEIFSYLSKDKKNWNGLRAEFDTFCKDQKVWLEEYSWFRVLMEQNDDVPTWENWKQEHRSFQAAQKWIKGLEESEQKEIKKRLQFFQFVQWLLFRQWKSVKKLGEEKGVRLMGDIPFGVSRHSADVWAVPHLFDLKWCGGAPPEPFFQHDTFTKVWGQNWGIPLYRWEEMEKENFQWWKRRVQGVTQIFGLFRIDHVLGFYRIYAFPWLPEQNENFAELSEEEVFEKVGALPGFKPLSDETEEGMEKNKGQGEVLLKQIMEAAGDSVIVAEDLGMVPDYVRPSLMELGISGFKIPLFERQEWDREYLRPEDYPELSLSTLATHDHDTMLGTWEEWWKKVETLEKVQTEEADHEDIETIQHEGTQASWELYRTLRFAGLSDQQLIREFEPQVREGICRRLLGSNSWLAVIMITDLFGMNLRFNIPGPVAESNWSERLPFKMEELNQGKRWTDISTFIREEIVNSGRLKEQKVNS